MNKWDKILVVAIVVFSLTAMVLFEVFAFGKSGERVEIYIDGQLQAGYNFRALTEAVEYECDTQYGYNKIVIDSKGAYVAASDCADKIEVKQGRIYKANTALVCLPNRLIVRIVGGHSDADIGAY